MPVVAMEAQHMAAEEAVVAVWAELGTQCLACRLEGTNVS